MNILNLVIIDREGYKIESYAIGDNILKKLLSNNVSINEEFYLIAHKTNDNYLMDHSSIIFLMDRKGSYVTHFSHQTQPSKLAAALREHIRASNGK